ncbi:hypothetical protein SAMN02910400_00598 [Lachnospiraceae bacterium C10]|nr:hypothetical protein SAMN02910400_00598 [Lachnospiraceae bacterium C10]
MTMTTIHDFIKVLNDLICEIFPNTEIIGISGSDYIKDCIFELREDNKRLQYSPYSLFNMSENYEETIEAFLLQWENYRTKNNNVM